MRLYTRARPFPLISEVEYSLCSKAAKDMHLKSLLYLRVFMSSSLNLFCFLISLPLSAIPGSFSEDSSSC